MTGKDDKLPRTGVSIAVFGPMGVLLVRRGKAPFKGHWSLPGGSQEFGETLEAAARRELHEETGLNAASLTLERIVEPMARAANGEISSHFVLAVFSCREFSGNAAAADDAEALQWLAPASLDGLQMTPGTAALVAEIAARR
jgi:ADP-ribose pyrophosphatase YjhB (NUDIX family)